MAILEGGVSASLAGVGVEAASPLHTVSLPPSYGALGYYAISMTSGTIAAALGANSEVFQFRYTGANLCQVYSIAVSAGANVAATAAALLSLRAVRSQSWTVDGTGGTAATLTGNNSKMRTSMGTTALGTARCATTAALGAGTKTLDTQDVGGVSYGVGTGAITVSVPLILLPLTEIFSGYPHPMTFATNEGFSVRSGIINPATMTWAFTVGVYWGEVSTY